LYVARVVGPVAVGVTLVEVVVGVVEVEVEVPVAAPYENRLSPFGPPQISPAAPDSWRQVPHTPNKKMVRLKGPYLSMPYCSARRWQGQLQRRVCSRSNIRVNTFCKKEYQIQILLYIRGALTQFRHTRSCQPDRLLDRSRWSSCPRRVDRKGVFSGRQGH
jgi:hypothetical protein